MRVWSIRSAEELEALARDGVLRTDASRIDPYMLPAYRWMSARLEKQSPSHGVEMPMWVWARAEPTQARPNLRRGGHVPKGGPGFMLELEIAPERLLLSDFDMWHAVLNNHFLERDDADYQAFEKAGLTGALLRRAIEESWEGVFDIARKTHPVAFWGPVEQAIVQGVLWEIRQEDVRGITGFRGC